MQGSYEEDEVENFRPYLSTLFPGNIDQLIGLIRQKEPTFGRAFTRLTLTNTMLYVLAHRSKPMDGMFSPKEIIVEFLKINPQIRVNEGLSVDCYDQVCFREDLRNEVAEQLASLGGSSYQESLDFMKDIPSSPPP